jgi:toxin ParE1/3/4
MDRSKPYRLHPLAWQEIDDGDDWYSHYSADAGIGFISAVSEAIETISHAPGRWPEYLHDTRRFVLFRFPYSVVYLDDPDFVSIVAVAHSKRKPGYWKQRL